MNKLRDWLKDCTLYDINWVVGYSMLAVLCFIISLLSYVFIGTSYNIALIFLVVGCVCIVDIPFLWLLFAFLDLSIAITNFISKKILAFINGGDKK